ncbi:MAG: coproporphyrinogen III oxidase [Sphingobacteriales bacterium 50-39]|nr:radical SAM family heme chaperone HemW [Sphingobacteriales bacterium]OJW56909.1 MAG: coproporphyrinogen III oxidase [Sphingobacteriales bacterium 50-39]
MAGIYLHIPFCRQACHYCNFHFSTSLQYKNDIVEALLKEMESRKDYIHNEQIQTIYFGGGTPSLLTADELERLLNKLHALFSISPDAELTLEANPDDMTTPGLLSAWRQAGINRLSIGIQSFFEEDLRWMNRVHNARQALESIRKAQDAGLDNISIDLIYGTPGLSDLRWKKNVEQAIQLGIPHLSCYALTVEPRTALDTMIRQHKKEDVDPEAQAQQFLLLMDWTAAAGYEHYEISNFSLPGRRSRHNTSYWQGKPYLGLGPSAHSYDGGASRQWNIANNALYIKNPLSGVEQEILSPVQQLNEFIMISLRTIEGLDLDQLAARWGHDKEQILVAHAERYIREGKMMLKDQHLILTREGKLLADGIAAALFFEEK